MPVPRPMAPRPLPLPPPPGSPRPRPDVVEAATVSFNGPRVSPVAADDDAAAAAPAVVSLPLLSVVSLRFSFLVSLRTSTWGVGAGAALAASCEALTACLAALSIDTIADAFFSLFSARFRASSSSSTMDIARGSRYGTSTGAAAAAADAGAAVGTGSAVFSSWAVAEVSPSSPVFSVCLSRAAAASTISCCVFSPVISGASSALSVS
mmetsp:Transcript_18032/g.43425  ORF Transcript_18032/g.43425 Transcript_18032/m.43425 type:complete len:208 (-) Transcript_18032:1673-2296(-)